MSGNWFDEPEGRRVTTICKRCGNVETFDEDNMPLECIVCSFTGGD